MPAGEDGEAARAGAEVEHAFHGEGILDQRTALVIALAAEMGLQQLADVGARHDHALVDIEGQAAHVDLVDQIGGGLSRGDAAPDHIDERLGLARGDPCGGKALELVGMQMQGFADQEGRFRHRIGRSVREYQLGFDEAAHRVADEIEQRHQFAGGDFRNFRGAAVPDSRCGALGHQDLVQRAAAASSWLRASTQAAPAVPSSRFQNGALVFR